MVRDLLDHAMSMVHSEQADKVRERATDGANDQIVDLLLPPTPTPAPTVSPVQSALSASSVASDATDHEEVDDAAERQLRTRLKLREQIASGKLEEREVELTITQKPQAHVMFANMGIDTNNT